MNAKTANGAIIPVQLINTLGNIAGALVGGFRSRIAASSARHRNRQCARSGSARGPGASGCPSTAIGGNAGGG